MIYEIAPNFPIRLQNVSFDVKCDFLGPRLGFSGGRLVIPRVIRCGGERSRMPGMSIILSPGTLSHISNINACITIFRYKM